MRILSLATMVLASGWMWADTPDTGPATPDVMTAGRSQTSVRMDSPADPDRFGNLPRLVWDDAGRVVTAPTRWDSSDWLKAGGAVLAIGTALALDRSTEQEMARHRTASADRFAKGVQNLGGTPSVLIAGGTWLAGVAFKDPEIRATGVDTMATMGIAQLLLAIPLKEITGRSRPSADKGAHDFHPFGGGQSFPSGHTTQAFALASVIAEHADTPWVSGLSYGLAGLVGVARIEQRQHFLSDVVAGGLIGTFVGKTVVRYNQSRRGEAGSKVAMSFTPMIQPGGYGVSLALKF